MIGRKLKFFGQALALSIISTLCPALMADTPTYQVEKAGYVNSPHGSVEAQCRPGDEAVEASCEGDFRGVSPRSREVDYPVVTEKTENGFLCKPRMLRYDQILMVIVEVTCKSAKTAKLAGVH